MKKSVWPRGYSPRDDKYHKSAKGSPKTEGFFPKDKTLFLLIMVVLVVFLYVIFFSNTEPITVTIEGCEYLETWGRYSRSLTHKGNCSSPIHIP